MFSKLFCLIPLMAPAKIMHICVFISLEVQLALKLEHCRAAVTGMLDVQSCTVLLGCWR